MTNRSTLILIAIFALSPLALRAQTAADNYKSKCQMCHSTTGLGDSPMGKSMKVPPFNSPDLIKMSDADLIAATTNGKGKMPAYTGKLTAPQIKDLVAYIRTLQK